MRTAVGGGEVGILAGSWGRGLRMPHQEATQPQGLLSSPLFLAVSHRRGLLTVPDSTLHVKSKFIRFLAGFDQKCSSTAGAFASFCLDEFSVALQQLVKRQFLLCFYSVSLKTGLTDTLAAVPLLHCICVVWKHACLHACRCSDIFSALHTEQVSRFSSPLFPCQTGTCLFLLYIAVFLNKA